MSTEDFQLTDDPAGIAHVAKVQSELGGKRYSATIQMHSGITYDGVASGHYFGEKSGTHEPRRVGGYILLEIPGRRIRLDALDIKSWSATPV